jgi:hypothetical protein
MSVFPGSGPSLFVASTIQGKLLSLKRVLQLIAVLAGTSTRETSLMIMPTQPHADPYLLPKVQLRPELVP